MRRNCKNGIKVYLAEKRRERKITQGMLAAKLGVGRSFIALLETGKRVPSYSRACQIASYFNCPVEKIFTPVGRSDGKGKEGEVEYERCFNKKNNSCSEK